MQTSVSDTQHHKPPSRREQRQSRHSMEARYGPWAVVTGASDGIGKAMAELLAERSFNLVLVARSDSRLQELAGQLERDFGIECQVIAIDLAEARAVESLQRETRLLDVGLLIAAAGFGTSGHFADSDLQTERDMLSLNCTAVVESVHHFARRFVERGSGGIVLMSSIVAFQGVPRSAHYAATKAYIQTLGEGLHSELAGAHVDVLCSAPGPVATAFADRANLVMSGAASPKLVARKTLDALGRRRTVRPGFLARLLAIALTLPRWARILVMTRVMAGMTRHQQTHATAEERG